MNDTQENVKYKFHCLRCDQDFLSRFEEPKRCGKCKSPYWNKPRVKIIDMRGGQDGPESDRKS